MTSPIALSSQEQVQLHQLRQDIDGVDDEILSALLRRLSLARAIGEIKQRTGQPVLDPAREASVVTRAAARAREAGLPEQEMRALYWQLMALARRAQLGPHTPNAVSGHIPCR
ncbi:MAG TPA: chorismate mutase [Gemmatimonas sp.]|uniref:chorismate mutase n=1 Tax=Gemmatimonas sp. TaxID=1962908 RepID=UPI002ED8AC94